MAYAATVSVHDDEGLLITKRFAATPIEGANELEEYRLRASSLAETEWFDSCIRDSGRAPPNRRLGAMLC